MKTADVGAYFDDRAQTFDSLYLGESPLMRRVNLTLRRAIYQRFDMALRRSGDVRGRTVLDVGCGSGRYMVQFARRDARSVVGIDLAPGMLDLARELAAREGVAGRCTFLEGDFLDHDFGDEQYDVVLAMGFFDYVNDPARVLSKMSQLSRGTVIASFPGRSLLRMHVRRARYRLRGCPVFFYTEQRLRELAAAAGMPDAELVYMPHSGTGWVLVGRVTEHSPEPPAPRSAVEAG